MRRLVKQQPSSWEIDVALDAYTAPPPVGQFQFQHQHQAPASGSQSPHSHALVFCKGIDHVAVRGTTKHEGVSFYNVYIFLKRPHSNIPTCRGQSSGEADIVIARRFSTFVNLRHEAYFHAHTGHASSRACDFCSDMTQRLYDDPALPKLHSKLFFGEAAICEALENCLSTILELTNKLPIALTGRQCDGQEEIPVLLQKFLTATE